MAALLPLIQSFLLCREIFRDERTKEVIIVGPAGCFTVPHFPATIGFQVFTQLTDCRGQYRFALSLRNAAEEEVWRWVAPEPIAISDPLEQGQGLFQGLRMRVSEPGRYRMFLLVNGEEVVQQGLTIRLPKPGNP